MDVTGGNAVIRPDFEYMAGVGGGVAGEEGTFVVVQGTGLPEGDLGFQGARIVVVCYREVNEL
jgi:hypothetical protein